MERRGTLLAGPALAVAVFLSGAVLLGVEIAASRVLAPTFGSSLYVWGALIGVVLSGLAVGYWVGGALADRWPSPYLLVGAIALGAVLVLAIPLVDQWVLDRVVSWDPGPRLDPLVAAIALFGPMSVVLASVSPIAVRLAARSLDRLGRTAGRLFSISTAGSIAGTFATAFWLVPEHGTDQVLAVGAVVLLAAAAAVALVERVWLPAAALVAGACAAVLAVGALAPDTTGGRLEGLAAKNWSPLYRQRDARTPRKLDPAEVAEAVGTGFTVREARETRYHRLLVVDAGGSRYLRFDSSFQSGMYIRQPFRTRFAYTDYLELGLAYNPNAKNVLVIGLGGASAPKRVWRDFGDVRLTVVELDPAVVETAYTWFALPRDPRIDVEVDDGRRYLQRHDDRYDVILLDAFYADGVPFHLTTLEFVELLRERLTPGGVIAANVIGALTGSSSRITRAFWKTYAAVFPTVLLHPVYEGAYDRTPDEIRNIILVATERAAPSRERLEEIWADVRRARAPNAPALSTAIGDRWQRTVRSDDVPLLTDGYAPTDALLLD
ncbi:fused MFS/spermidine synthase [Gaiella sp.]|uniref:fused MFS/spermidine synthase n=1 Tax=Gaiella sp. TaxID=2663207 RepID=UPI002E35C3B7|nr:fused MFS/spermidine synthase [Gaiella sp.]HEX5583511.1 fused MFS/spermidine synthase [Gaiella sp.]